MTVLAASYRDAFLVAGQKRARRRQVYIITHVQSALVDVTPREAAWKRVVEDRLQKLLEYSDGWDGYDAKPPRRSAIVFAREILASVMTPRLPAPSIVPLSGGGIQLEWHVSGLDIELTIYRPYDAELSVEFSDGREPIEEERLTINFERLGSLLSELA